MSTPPTDPDSKQIHFSESFRKAKRNVLFWAMATGLIALGSTDAEKHVEVTGFIRNLSFEQGLITAGCLLVLVIMQLGYIRAERDLLARNTQFGRDHDTHQAIEVIERVRKELEIVETGASAARGAVQRQKEHLARLQHDVAEALAPLPDEAFNGRSGLKPAMLPEATGGTRLKSPAELSDAELRTIAEGASDKAMDEARQWLRDAIVTLNSRLQDLTGDFASRTINTSDADHATHSALAKLRPLASDLRGFADSISTANKRWFWAYDRGLVWGAFGIAALIATWRLAHPHSLGALVSRIF